MRDVDTTSVGHAKLTMEVGKGNGVAALLKLRRATERLVCILVCRPDGQE